MPARNGAALPAWRPGAAGPVNGPSPAGIAVPACQIDAAMAGLRAHVRMIHDASAWLYCDGSHSAAAYFAILCLEEISRHHALDRCRDGGRDATAGDMGSGSHTKKILSFLLWAHGLSGAGGDRLSSANYSLAAAKLNYAKQLAVYHEYWGGGAHTLEGVLGREALLELSTRLQQVASLGISAMDAPACGRQGRRRGAGSRSAGTGIGADVAAILGLLRGVPVGNRPDDVVLEHRSLGHVLKGLEWHVGCLDIWAVKLHNGYHYEASVLMSILSFEEANKHYVIAGCRRRGHDVKKGVIRRLQRHRAKLSAFFRDVERCQRRLNGGRGLERTEKYHTVDPEELLRLNGLKKISLHFAHMCGRTVTLQAILGAGAGNVSIYLRKTLMGMASWAIMCDGNSDDPYEMRGDNPIHVQRLKVLVDFKMDEKNRDYDAGMCHAIGVLDRLHDAVWSHDEKACGEALYEIQGIL